ncbi:phosphopantetheine-binding protein [Nonomuraea sp. NPDC050404]|uniref:phosphopantetheine-binding protein n=1 Tax=Nonomuraea sp. NPDC050404 TaxID=3155783 RepID=UPI0033F3EC6A
MSSSGVVDAIEVLRQHPDVVDAVLVEVEVDGRTASIAAVRVNDYCSPQLLREHVHDLLGGTGKAVDGVWVEEAPDHPVPGGGAIDLAAIRATLRERADEVIFVAPRGDMEEQLATLYAEVLELSRVGATDDFMDLGGDSLSAARLLAALQERWAAEIDVFDLLETSTVRGLARLLRERERG